MSEETHSTTMDSLRFIQIIQAYGSNPKRWPEAERAEAIKFSQRKSAQDLLHGEHGFDSALSGLSAQAPEPSEFLKARILKAAQNTPQIANDRPASFRLFAGIAALALIAITVTLSSGFIGGGDIVAEPLYETPDEFLAADLDALWDESFFSDPI